ncbi:cytochrome o ubiquinol oxidase subunit IV [Mangrovibacterium sp.]|uniref:cytochrome o ubiquinol oxidase subunit IV n=1 Tax=Mangrovibacterium sp. TaxID=1961364 RepID=UPI0035677349
MSSNHTPNEQMGSAHSGYRSYLVGFALAVFFTLISFSMVILEAVPKGVAVVGLSVAALLQMLVHLRYFLHLDTSSAQRWNLVLLAFTALLVFIFIGGTMWVMYTLNSRMM